MKISLKGVALMFAMLGTTLFVLKASASQTSQAQVEIIGGTGTYNVSGSIDLSGRNASTTAYSKNDVNATFATDSFVINDMVGGSPWYLTIKSSDLTDGSDTISSGNVYIKLVGTQDSTGASSCSTDITTNLTPAYAQLNSAITWLQRTGSTTSLCKAAVTPNIGIDIPAGQAVGTYTGTLTITSQGAGALSYSSTLTY